VTALVGAPKVKAVRGFSDFGASYVYVIFEDGTDIYRARSRTTEYLSAALPRLPQGVKTELGPDANGLGWVYQYALVDESGTRSLADLRSYQDRRSCSASSEARSAVRESRATCRSTRANRIPIDEKRTPRTAIRARCAAKVTGRRESERSMRRGRC
jgi:AcrB/AcrD/AcrF family